MHLKKPYFFIKIFLFTSIILPSGSVAGINVKMLLMLLLVFIFALYRKGVLVVKLVRVLIPIVVLLLLFMLYSYIINKNSEFIISQAKDILTFSIMAGIAYAFVEKEDYESVVFTTIIKALIVCAVFKFFIFIYAALTATNVSSIVRAVSGLFGVQIMTFDVDGAAIGRVGFTSDVIIPFVLFVLFKKNIHDRDFKYLKITIAILLFSVFISMSRFYWASTITVFLMASVGAVNKKKSLVYMFSILVATLAILSTESAQKMIESRMSSENNNYSDGIRELQAELIARSIETAPILGHGIGYYIPSFIRSTDDKYSYELQIQALIMQLGVVGVALFILIVFLVLITRSSKLNLIDKVNFLLLIGLWFSSGLFNPVLFSSSGGIAFLMLYIIPDLKPLKRDVCES
ncbi:MULTISPECIES: O-antigen ligase family protein [unclassified Serratia (in: enterobacteria)]|uniref:O-antigen ligase family protein n=1 Tax=unclassified Serratia (in: enterobacteria) TaxID=2647522 RepID=UPI003075F61B